MTQPAVRAQRRTGQHFVGVALSVATLCGCGSDMPGMNAAHQRARSVNLDELAQAVLPDEVLSKQRGGMSIMGMDLSFGLQIQTAVQGQLALITTLNLNSAGQF